MELSDDKQSEGVFIEKAVKTTILHDKGNYDNADDVLKEYIIIEVNERRRPDLEELNDAIQGFYA